MAEVVRVILEAGPKISEQEAVGDLEEFRGALERLEACHRNSKGSHPITLRSVFGGIAVASPRLRSCPCQEEARAPSARWRILCPSTRSRSSCFWKRNGPI